MALPDWQVTATRIYCDAVDADVTIMVFKDWSTGCSGYKKYYGKNIEKEMAQELKRRGKRVGRELKCEGLGYHRVVGYKNKLSSEQKARPRKTAKSP